MNSGKEANFRALTGLRMVAASLVFIYHNRKYWRSSLHPELLRFLNEGHMGVSLFFVLSGFLIAYTYADKTLDSPGSYLRYLALRAARILPLYWLILTACYVDWGFPSTGQTWATYTLAHAFSRQHILDAIAQAWSLNVELCFYLLAPVLYFLMKKRALFPLLLCLGMLGVAGLTGMLWHRLNGNPLGVLYPFDFILQSTFFGRFMEFLWGMQLAAVMRRDLQWDFLLPKKHSTLIGALGITASLYLIGLLEPNIFTHGTDHPLGLLLRATLFPWLVVCLLHGLITERTALQRFLGSPPMELLGKASFAFYLIHISYVNIRIRQWVLLPDRNFVLLWVVSILLYLLFEKPVNQMLRKMIQVPQNA
ncbi:MAG: acyltransferase [Bacteroidetes bacterium]|nr:acyltransferase [Bacteroidota bacterium]